MPTVTSLHVPPFDALHSFVRDSAAPGHRLTVTSKRQRDIWWPEGAPAEASVLHNGIDPAAWPWRPHGDGGVAWCGRVTPNKGTHLAIDAARSAGLPLTLIGPVEDMNYWSAAIAPRLGGDVRHAGHLDAAALAAELGRASLFAFTPCWDEPFGLVAIEAMACGLPVAAFDRGAAREVIGEAGCFAAPDNVGVLADAMTAALAIPRTIPRARVERLFTRDRWLDACEVLYEEARAARTRLAA